MQLVPGVYSLGVNKGFESHAFLIDGSAFAGGKGLTLIDTLFDADAAVILEEIRTIGHNVNDLKHIVLTHAHRSHLGGLATLKRISGATVYSHGWEADIIAGERAAQQVSWLPQDPLVTYHFQIGNNINISKHTPARVDQFVEEGDQIGPLQVIHTPGHTPGHLAFWLPALRVLFCGDAVVTSPKFMAGWPAFTLNKRQHENSLLKLAGYDAEILAFGHGEPITKDGAARLKELLSTMGI
jgi:glyoxylase-like metal-dependent hydrolase (beta-lactamase superfamily II)